MDDEFDGGVKTQFEDNSAPDAWVELEHRTSDLGDYE